jgi:hypothetical protein
MSFKQLLVIASLLTVVSCTETGLYEKVVFMKGNEWSNAQSPEFNFEIKDTSANISKGIEFIAANNRKLTGITQIGNIKPLEITRTQNQLADRALAKMKNAYSLKLYQ